MSDYDEPFEDETPKTPALSTHSSHISTEEPHSEASDHQSSGEATTRQSGSGSDEGGGSGKNGGGAARSRRPAVTPVVPAGLLAKAAPAVPVPVPVPVPVATFPSAVPVPTPGLVATLSGEEDDDEDTTHVGKAGNSGEGEQDEATLWRAHTDARTGKTYYYNTKTKVTSWQLPAALQGRSEPANADATRQRENAQNSSNSSHGNHHNDDGGDDDSSRRPTNLSETTPSTSVSILPGAAGERQRMAIDAQGRDEFQRLNQYVAFGGSASSPSFLEAGTGRPSFITTDGSSVDHDKGDPLTLHDLLGAHALGERSGEAQGVNVSSQPPPPASGDGEEQHADDNPTPHDEEDPSSVFSTLSAHLRPASTAAPAEEHATVTATHTAAAAAAQEESAAAALPTTTPSAPSTGPAAERKADVPSGGAQLTITLPSLPPPSFATTGGAAAPSAAAAAASSSGAGSGLHSNNYYNTHTVPSPHGAVLPPPLPPPVGGLATGVHVGLPEAFRPEDPKLAELRETSEAVERLVRAFATLRGHGTTMTATKDLKGTTAATSAAERLGDTTMHRVGARSTIRPTRESVSSLQGMPDRGHATRAPTASAPLTTDEKAAVASNEAVLEELLASCVLEMLQEDLGKVRRTQRLADRFKMKPQHVTVSAEEFRTMGATAASLSAAAAAQGDAETFGARPRRASAGRGPLSVFDSELRAFDASGDGEDVEGGAAAALFDSVQSNLRKYVLSHVVDPTQPQEQQQHQWRPPAPSPGGGAVPTPVTPHFAWILLMDLLSVCTDILERGFANSVDSGAASIPSTPVIVRYDGERHCELLARNAIHCLPFEVLEAVPASSEGGDDTPHLPRRRPLFRMEFWVTRAALFTVVDALAATIRQHIAHMANTAPYAIFATDINPYVNARVLAPSKVPMFSVVLDRQRQGRGASPAGVLLAGAHAQKARADMNRGPGAKSGNEDAFFHVPQPCLQSLAYTVSTIATEMEQKRQPKPTAPTARDGAAAVVPSLASYDELARSVTESVEELLADAGVRAAVERRSQEKLEAMQKARRDYPGKDRMERERIVVQRAEKEAEDLVRRIAQEMLVREAGV